MKTKKLLILLTMLLIMPSLSFAETDPICPETIKLPFPTLRILGDQVYLLMSGEAKQKIMAHESMKSEAFRYLELQYANTRTRYHLTKGNSGSLRINERELICDYSYVDNNVIVASDISFAQKFDRNTERKHLRVPADTSSWALVSDDPLTIDLICTVDRENCQISNPDNNTQQGAREILFQYLP